MENDLASQLIAANEEERRPEEPNIDELGIPLPKLDTKKAHYNYLVARALYTHPHLHTRKGRTQLWDSHTKLRPTVEDMSSITKWPEFLSKQGALYIFDKIKELVPYLDENILAITPHLAWDIENQKLIESEEEFNVVSDW